MTGLVPSSITASHQIAGLIWLGDISSETRECNERLRASSGDLNDKGQWTYDGKVGGCLITGNEDGIKHRASNVLHSLRAPRLAAQRRDAGRVARAAQRVAAVRWARRPGPAQEAR